MMWWPRPVHARDGDVLVVVLDGQHVLAKVDPTHRHIRPARSCPAMKSQVIFMRRAEIFHPTSTARHSQMQRQLVWWMDVHAGLEFLRPSKCLRQHPHEPLHRHHAWNNSSRGAIHIHKPPLIFPHPFAVNVSMNALVNGSTAATEPGSRQCSPARIDPPL